MGRRAAALAGAALLFAACGGGDGGRFDHQVDAVRDAVATGDREQALQELDAIALLATDAGASGELDPAEVEEIVRLVEQGRALVDQQLPAPTTTTTTTTTTAPPMTEDEDDEDDDEEDEGKGKGKGEGEGRGNGTRGRDS